jgi:hypothetical protein
VQTELLAHREALRKMPLLVQAVLLEQTAHQEHQVLQRQAKSVEHRE